MTDQNEASASTKPTILIDARKLGHGGIGTYLRNLILALEDSKLFSFSLIISSKYSGQKFWPVNTVVFQDDSKGYSLEEMFILPRRLKKLHFDLFHAPHYTLPFGIKVPSVVTLHDLIHISHPPSVLHPLIARPLIRSALKRATEVISVSENTKVEAVTLMRGNGFAEKISVISNALPPRVVYSDMELSSRLKDLGVRQPYFLCVSSLDKPHKGVGDLLKAYTPLAAKHRFPDLILVGQGTRSIQTKGPSFGDKVRVLGEVRDFDLISLYKHALALIAPSRAEGFCFPVLEAKALGIPIIARPVPAIKEILGAKDTCCTDFSVKALGAAIRDFILNPYPGILVPNAEWFERYSLNTLRQKTESVYLRALGRV